MSAGSSFESGARVGQMRRGNMKEDKKQELAKQTQDEIEKNKKAREDAVKSGAAGYYTTESGRHSWNDLPNDSTRDIPVRKTEGGKYQDLDINYE